MSQLPRFSTGDNAPATHYEKDLERSLDKQFEKIGEILNKGLRFADNFDAYIGALTTNATPGVETAIAHGLKRVPSGFLVIQKDKAAHIYNGSTAWTADNIYVRSDVASVTATLIIF